MASTLLKSLVAGSLMLSSSVATAQATSAPSIEPAADATLGSNGESALRGNRQDAITAIIFGLIVFVIAVWVGRHGGDDDGFVPHSP